MRLSKEFYVQVVVVCLSHDLWDNIYYKHRNGGTRYCIIDHVRKNFKNLRKWSQRGFRLDIRGKKKKPMDRVAKHWNGLPQKRVESPSLEVLKKHVDMACEGSLMVNKVMMLVWWLDLIIKIFNDSLSLWTLLLPFRTRCCS